MGAYSTMDIDKCYEDDPFEEDAFEEGENLTPSAETVLENPDTAPSALEKDEDRPPQVIVSLEPSADPQDNKSQENAEIAAIKEDGDAADQADEDAKRKAHEEAEAKRKAEWEAEQQKKKAALQEKLDRLAAMSDDEVMMASAKQVGADTEKITRRNMKDCVTEFIQTKCLDDPAFARKVMNPCKSMIHCFRYISRRAWEYVQDELKADGITPGHSEQGYGCDIPDDLCYQWSEDYFNDPDAKEDQVEEEKFVPKPYYGGGKTKRSVKGKSKPADKKSASPKKAEEKPTQKPAEDSGQISFGDFTMPEEKAG